MSIEFIVGSIFFGIIVLALVGLAARKAPRPIHKEYFQKRWVDLLAKVKTQDGMTVAVIDADKLLDEALKRRHYRGRTMGERLVAAQRQLSDNDAAWYAHKLRNRLVHEADVRLKENEAKRALAGARQALKDLGAL